MEPLRNPVGKIVEGGEAHAVVVQVSDIAGAAPELVFQRGGDHLIDGAVHALEAGGEENVLLAGEGEVLVGVHADGPFPVFLGGGDGAVARDGAYAEEDIGTIFEILLS